MHRSGPPCSPSALRRGRDCVPRTSTPRRRCGRFVGRERGSNMRDSLRSRGRSASAACAPQSLRAASCTLPEVRERIGVSERHEAGHEALDHQLEARGGLSFEATTSGCAGRLDGDMSLQPFHEAIAAPGRRDDIPKPGGVPRAGYAQTPSGLAAARRCVRPPRHRSETMSPAYRDRAPGCESPRPSGGRLPARPAGRPIPMCSAAGGGRDPRHRTVTRSRIATSRGACPRRLRLARPRRTAPSGRDRTPRAERCHGQHALKRLRRAWRIASSA
jgi:hypothetical protein